MPFSFPSSPTVGQQSTQNGRVYAWSGAAWELASQIASHTHSLSDLTQSGATANQVVAWNGTAWAPATVSGGGSYTLPTATASVLGGVKIGGGVTITDGVISVSTNYAAASHTHAWTDITSGRPTTLSGYGITDAVASSDARLTNSREWSADTISQAEAEAGTATTRRAFTAQRAFQAIAAWWAASSAKTKLDGIATGATANATDAQLRDRSTHTGTQAASTISDFSTAAVAAVTWTTLTGKPASFSPSSHKASHATGGSDALTAADIGAAAAGHTHALSSITDAGTAASRNVPATGNAGSAQVVLGSDTRLSDARTPTAHTHTSADVTSTSNATTFNQLDSLVDAIQGNGWAFAREQIIGAAALSHSHAASAITSGTIDIARIPTGTASTQVCVGNDPRLTDARTPTSHAHGNITNAGAIGSTSGQIVVTTTSGVLTTATIGSGLTLSGGTLSASGGGGGSSVGSDLYLWATFR